MQENTDLPSPNIIDKSGQSVQPVSDKSETSTPAKLSPTSSGKSYAFILPLVMAIAVVVIGALIISSLVRKLNRGPGGEGATTPTAAVYEAPSITPAILRSVSAIASQSAFMELDAAINSLNAGITGYVVQDLTLSPPVLDLKLGFTN